jgi:hypothetical protein
MVYTDCGGLVGGANLACLSAEASYLPVIMGLSVFFAILYFRMNFEPAGSRFAASLFVTSLVALLLSVGGFLPTGIWGITAILAVGSASMLAIKS